MFCIRLHPLSPAAALLKRLFSFVLYPLTFTVFCCCFANCFRIIIFRLLKVTVQTHIHSQSWIKLLLKKKKEMKLPWCLQVLKWNFIELRAEFVEQLKGQMEKNFNRAIMADLFHSDFKSHIRAIEQLMKVWSFAQFSFNPLIQDSQKWEKWICCCFP